ncbi:MAG: barstar family protein, partial [Xanthomonadales bacterium]|nr:barstar family protein [Xanthomonadales bacterium]
MTHTIDMDLLDPAQAGIYFVTSQDLDALDDMGRQSGSLVCRINLEGCRDKDDLLQRFADAFDFPDDFGHNWDALEDS